MIALPLAPIASATLPPLDLVAPALPNIQAPGSVDFSSLLTAGVQSVNNDMLAADKMAHDFALNDSMPVHQVTYALAQAELSMNLMVQVRNRLVEAYQQLMNMQL